MVIIFLEAFLSLMQIKVVEVILLSHINEIRMKECNNHQTE